MILVFAGAGASKAVNPSQYPTTVEFFERLPDEIRKGRLFNAVHTFLRGITRSDVIDIEQILWALQDWESFASTAQNSAGFPGWLLEENRIIKVTGQGVDWRLPLGVVASLTGESKELVGEINRHVYEWYGRLPIDQELRESWMPLFDELLQIDPRLEVFTTNYDLVLEAAIDLGSLPVDIGRRGVIQPVLAPHLWDLSIEETSQRARGLLTKLHGSVDWSRGENRVHVGVPTFRGNHAEHVIIYPGFKGTPDKYHLPCSINISNGH